MVRRFYPASRWPIPSKPVSDEFRLKSVSGGEAESASASDDILPTRCEYQSVSNGIRNGLHDFSSVSLQDAYALFPPNGRDSIARLIQGDRGYILLGVIQCFHYAP
jgi:hypothetical protein